MLSPLSPFYLPLPCPSKVLSKGSLHILISYFFCPAQALMIYISPGALLRRLIPNLVGKTRHGVLLVRKQKTMQAEEILPTSIKGKDIMRKHKLQWQRKHSLHHLLRTPRAKAPFISLTRRRRRKGSMKIRRRHIGSKSRESPSPEGKKEASVGLVGFWQHTAPGHQNYNDCLCSQWHVWFEIFAGQNDPGYGQYSLSTHTQEDYVEIGHGTLELFAQFTVLLL
eukprot:1156713-Pelagomonas_calceolata.AAC.3